MMKNYDLTYIVDDDPIFVLLFKKILQKSNRFGLIKNLANGQEAIDELIKLDGDKKEFPNIIFLDINMPILDGWQFLESLQKYEFKEKLTIYIVSSSIDYYEIEKSKKFKTVRNFISKPLTVSFFDDYII